MSSSTSFARQLLRGAGQVCFCDSAVAGACFVVAVFVGSVAAGCGALLGLLTATIVGRAFVSDDAAGDADHGLYGFNGFLVGAALATLRGFDVVLAAAIVVGAAVTTPLFAALRARGWSPLTAPFLVVTWAALLVPIGAPPDAVDVSVNVSVDGATGLPALVQAALLGLAQVFLQQSPWSALLVVIGLAIGLRHVALSAVAASALATAMATVAGVDVDVIGRGLCGYDAALGAIGWCAIVGRSARDSAIAVVVGLACAVVGVAVGPLFAAAGLPALTFGFVVTLSVILALRHALRGRRSAWQGRA